jgi:hypothetical protein
MDIKSTKCRLNRLSKKQRDSLVEAMPKSGLFDFNQGEGFIGFSSAGRSGTWVEDYKTKIISYDEMMQLLTGKSMKEFTKADLKTGMFVNLKDGSFAMVIGESISKLNWWIGLVGYNDTLESAANNDYDIMAVYEAAGTRAINMYLKGDCIKLIWERTELTPAQQEMEVLQAKMDELREKNRLGINALYEQMEVVRAKL